ncbi:response regulator transcription factor [Weissella paramesenteroides]|uniref:Response regulator receiver domain protein n=4 Tax=Weissella paramesenteroides TaxID=1249 RepID=C5R9L9_WEIPA|nr:response regulator transcription factor [Weissella paramesenteroides]ATF42117.1 DNA-binding response regulator [Weissella paramesenteroides]EER75119.1 response regulator receiver domain protein [Weissella paramesenteroides ATCC 33313]MDF8366295.1 response regulator transcription factor [Weissella paramesenteroides]MDF8368913.1 response regulator transcription factor [Weissella paramesenteroides]MDF8370926.1 response regulator transcription factor [Weissella paramesenteroides]
MKTKILLVEDEEGLADSLKTELELEDMVVIWAKDGQEALDLFHEHEQELNLIILDWMLPKLDGFSVLRRIRKHSQMPVIMLTARDYIGDKVAGLTGGADDYMTKPFEVEELLARIEVSLRHSQKTDHQAKIYTVGDLTVDTTTKRVSRHNKIIPLTQREYELLVVLVMNEDEACSRDGLLDEVWGVDFEGQPNILDVYVRNLRSKIDADPSNQKLIHTVRGVGYMLSQNVQDR